MPHPPPEFASLIIAFAPLFSERVWQAVPVLLAGAILTPGRRTVSSALPVMGLAEAREFQKYHRVLNRAVWSCREGSAILLRLLVVAFAPRGPLVLGLDDTLERRWGKKIKARGIYRDPVRSSHRHLVKASGLRWLSLMLLAPIPWANRVWALPFLTVLAPSERYHQGQGVRHKKLTDWGRQRLRQVRRWFPERELIVVADSRFAALDFLARLVQCRQPIYCITRLRLDAARYAPAPPRRAGQPGRPRWQTRTVKHWYGQTQRTVELTSGTAVWYHWGQPCVPLRWVLVRDPEQRFPPQAFLCTQLQADPVQILEWFVQRWPMEVTFQQARAHLGIETQRQWSDKAIARTTPILFGLYSVVTLWAQRLINTQTLPVRSTAWYTKECATFSDTLALVRRHLGSQTLFSISPAHPAMIKIPRALFERLTDTLCYVA